MAAHFIAMSGTHGCLPDYCQSHDTDLKAAAALGAVHDLSGRTIRRLLREGSIELGGPETGAEYAEIIGCNCNTPEDHNDN